ncbi:SnoaL-like protein [Alloalcanivorax xenomutans]|uniref:nuclear transport factor 2 family protein n=1 Tax=Alloalcanivorax xenomutans TaxID=1094342 RepID=UPI000BC5A503|nr:nuclear transport factor 2 family protein [Alloalcanivorax xenomutans]SOC27667.1 SnoaL-like protein [Alloalcanivorax xenomutans]
MPHRLNHADLQNHARHWIEAWNRGDVEAVVSAFSDDAEFISAVAELYVGTSRIQGKAALRDYWVAALADRPGLHFELVAAICDEPGQQLVVHYIASANGKRAFACEIMRFDNGRQVYGEALYGAPVL